MIKQIVSLTVAGVVASMISGCGAEPTPKQAEPDFRCKQESELAPKWTCNPFVESSYAGVGIAKKSAAGMGHMRRVALANGRSDLAQQIKSQVKDKVETFTSTTGMGDKETVDTVTTAVSKQVAKVDLQGSRQVESWTSHKGTLYLLVAVPEAPVNKAVKSAVVSSMKNDNALWQQFQSKNALDGLEKEFPTN